MQVVKPLKPFWFDDIVKADQKIGQESANDSGGDIYTVVKLMRFADAENDVDRGHCVDCDIGQRSFNFLMIAVVLVEVCVAVRNRVHKKVGDEAAQKGHERVG